MNSSGKRIDIRHHAITQAIVGKNSLVSRMILGSDVPHLTQRPLSMCAIDRNKTSKLIPASLQFAPLIKVGILLSSSIEELLSCNISVLNTESPLIHSPHRKSGKRIVQTCCHLGTHILPACTYIATPRSSAVALFTSKSTPGEQEHTLIRINLTLTIIYCIGINNRIGIEILSGRT